MINSSRKPATLRTTLAAACTMVAFGFALANAQSPTPAKAPTPLEARAALRMDDGAWREICSVFERPAPTLGYSAEEMALYGRDRYRLRTVENLFRDVRSVSRTSGRCASGFLTAGTNPAALLEQAFLLTDVSSARMLPMPDSAAWGCAGLSDSLAPADALDAWIARGDETGVSLGRIAEADRAAFRALDARLQRLTMRVLIGAGEAAPWIRAAFDDPRLAALIPFAQTGDPAARADSLYAFATAPWREERLGQMATLRGASIDAIGWADRDYLAFGSILLLTHVDRALDEYRDAISASNTLRAPAQSVTIETELGTVRILTGGADTLDEPAAITIDPGGNDTYRGRHAASAGPRRPIALLIDLAGDDAYISEQTSSLGCGLFGVAAIIDLAGDDRYQAPESALGTGWYGAGLVLDHAGDDTYTLEQHWGLGMASVGVGVLADSSGNDTYTCGFDAQGYGATYGAGVLVDANGDDRYIARDDGNISALYLNQSVSMSQGVGQGRRADLGDGHSLAGGIGALIDGAGDDRYHATAWSQGAGYWWAAGFLEDLGGNDSYRNGKYSLGAGAHFAIGSHGDLSGDDRYNIGNEDAVNQFQGHARDGSIGISIDGGGDDEYLFKSHCGGSGDLNSIGFFWDRSGADRYRLDYTPPGDPTGWNDTPPLGTVTRYEPFNTWRDDIQTYGVFLDTGGDDTYSWQIPDSLEARESARLAGNNRRWPTARGLNGRGLGWDVDSRPSEQR